MLISMYYDPLSRHIYLFIITRNLMPVTSSMYAAVAPSTINCASDIFDLEIAG